MSGWPSPLKSATPDTIQFSATLPSDTLEEKLVPLISQITRLPVEVSVHRMSELPSLLKSPEPSISQFSVTLPSDTLEAKLVPLISQITRLPVEVSVQSRPGCPPTV